MSIFGKIKEGFSKTKEKVSEFKESRRPLDEDMKEQMSTGRSYEQVKDWEREGSRQAEVQRARATEDRDAKREEKRQAELAYLHERGDTAKDKWEAQATTRQISDERRKEDLKVLESKKQTKAIKAEIAQKKAEISAAKKLSRESGIVGSYLTKRSEGKEARADRQSREYIAEIKSSRRSSTRGRAESPVEVSGPNSNLYGMGNLRQLTAPRMPGTSSPSGLSPIGDLSHLRGMTIGNPANKKLSPNQTNVLLAMQGGITANKEISDITSMPIMQVARAKSGLRRKGVVKA